jgi:hypothetical protein
MGPARSIPSGHELVHNPKERLKERSNKGKKQPFIGLTELNIKQRLLARYHNKFPLTALSYWKL